MSIEIVKQEVSFDPCQDFGYWTITIYSACGNSGTSDMCRSYSEAMDSAMADLLSILNPT